MAKRISPTAAKKKADKLLHNKRPLEARKLFADLIKTTPQDHEAWLGFALASMQIKNLGEAEAALRKTLELQPDTLLAYGLLAQLMLEQGRNQEAEAVCRVHLKFAPQDFKAHYRLGSALNRQGQFAEARQILEKASSLGRGFDAEFFVQYGQALLNQGEFDEAQKHLQTALKLQPDHTGALEQLANLYKEQNQFDLAQQCYQQIATLQPDKQALYPCNMASLSDMQGDHGHALALLNQAVNDFPNSIDVHWRRAAALLLNGIMPEGWAEYESRLNHPAWIAAMGRCEFNKPRLSISDVKSGLQGKTVMVYSEQGYGDTLHFSRYLRLLHECGAKVVFYCDKELLPLFEHQNCIERLEARSYQKAQQEQFDFHTPLMSLPYLFQTTLETIPTPLGSLTLDEHKLSDWQRQLADSSVLKVGIVWAGRPTHISDRRRSCKFEQFKELLNVDGVQFVSLQKGEAAKQLQDSKDVGVLDVADQLNDFSDTAALIKNLDLVISVDTAVVHLAGTLGCPVWTLVYHPAEWRWLLEREDSPWYPSMCLFRQQPGQGWNDVLVRVKDALQRFVSQR